MERQVILFMAAIGAIILLIACGVQGKMEGLVTFLMRGLLGALGIHFVNIFLYGLGFPIGIGINLLTFLTTGILGLPGFLGLYAVGIFHLM